jgi:hypothetical protein
LTSESTANLPSGTCPCPHITLDFHTQRQQAASLKPLSSCDISTARQNKANKSLMTFSPLKKPNKSDYTVAKSLRPISLLSTLGKALELVIAGKNR